jgi:hypothetical protein
MFLASGIAGAAIVKNVSGDGIFRFPDLAPPDPTIPLI